MDGWMDGKKRGFLYSLQIKQYYYLIGNLPRETSIAAVEIITKVRLYSNYHSYVFH